jgi:phosphotransferase system HPr (HPr) family protein
MAEATVRVDHASGLHARPLAAFVRVAKGFAAEIKVQNVTTGKGPANGKSPVHLLMLTAQQGHELRIVASGVDEDAALAALTRLVADDFDQGDGDGGH